MFDQGVSYGLVFFPSPLDQFLGVPMVLQIEAGHDSGDTKQKASVNTACTTDSELSTGKSSMSNPLLDLCKLFLSIG